MTREKTEKSFDEMPIGLMLRMTEHAHDCLVREKMDSIGAPKAFGPILFRIRDCEGMMQSDLAKSMYFSAPTISVAVQKLEESGYIIRKPDENDQRQSRVYLTDDGIAFTKKMDETFMECEKILTDGIPEEDIEKLRSILTKMRENIK